MRPFLLTDCYLLYPQVNTGNEMFDKDSSILHRFVYFCVFCFRGGNMNYHPKKDIMFWSLPPLYAHPVITESVLLKHLMQKIMLACSPCCSKHVCRVGRRNLEFVHVVDDKLPTSVKNTLRSLMSISKVIQTICHKGCYIDQQNKQSTKNLSLNNYTVQ